MNAPPTRTELEQRALRHRAEQLAADLEGDEAGMLLAEWRMNRALEQLIDLPLPRLPSAGS